MNRYVNSLIAIAIAILTVLMILALTSEQPAQTLYSFIMGPLKTAYHTGNMLAIASILILCGIGMSISFQAGLFNLGGEGQMYVAGSIGALTGLILPPVTGVLGMLIIALVSMSVGAGIAAVSGYLRSAYNIHELISSFLLSSALVLGMDYLIAGPLRDTSGFLQSTRKIPEAFHLPSIMSPSNLSVALFIAVAAAGAAALWLYKTPAGYEIRVQGSNPVFSLYGRIPRYRSTVLPMAINGAFYGLAGALMVMSTQHAAIVGFTAGYGWNGIAISLIAYNNPIMTIPAALLMAWIESGIRTAMSGTSLSFQISTLIRGIILLLITLQFLRHRGPRR
jgi:simple sugar transport system permease protein